MALMIKLLPIIVCAPLRPPRLRDRDDDLLEQIDIGLQCLLSGRNVIETQDVRYDVEIGLIVQAPSPSRRHRVANCVEPLREGLPLPSELEGAVGQVGRLRFGATEVGAVAAGADPLVSRLAFLGLLLGKDAGRSGFRLLCMEQARSAEQQQAANGNSGQHWNGPLWCATQADSSFGLAVRPELLDIRPQNRGVLVAFGE